MRHTTIKLQSTTATLILEGGCSLPGDSFSQESAEPLVIEMVVDLTNLNANETCSGLDVDFKSPNVVGDPRAFSTGEDAHVYVDGASWGLWTARTYELPGGWGVSLNRVLV